MKKIPIFLQYMQLRNFFYRFADDSKDSRPPVDVSYDIASRVGFSLAL